MRLLKMALGFGLGLGVGGSSAAKVPSQSEMQREVRVEHARELLGKYYPRSVVRQGEKFAKINRYIYLWVREHLPSGDRERYQAVAQAIIDESLRYEFDPVFLLSVIQGESSFNPSMEGALDEIGLMQLRPGTAEWIAKREGINFSGAESLFDPVTNIRLGAAYLAYLREKFDSHAQLYLAAYNMGARSVEEARAQSIWPKDYPAHVMKVYVEFYSSLDPEMGSSAKSRNE